MEFVLLALVIITIFGIGRIVCRELKKKTDILVSGKEGEVFPIPVKEGISEERKKQFKGVWDAKKLFRELLDITQSVEGWQIDFDKTNHSMRYTTKCERIISVINAFNGRKGIEAKCKPISMRNLISKTYPDEKKSELISSIKELLPNIENKRIEDIFNPQREFLSRMQLFGILYSYRCSIKGNRIDQISVRSPLCNISQRIILAVVFCLKNVSILGICLGDEMHPI